MSNVKSSKIGIARRNQNLFYSDHKTLKSWIIFEEVMLNLVNIYSQKVLSFLS